MSAARKQETGAGSTNADSPSLTPKGGSTLWGCTGVIFYEEFTYVVQRDLSKVCIIDDAGS